jgi:MATE family multidrug resistance protein
MTQPARSIEVAAPARQPAHAGSLREVSALAAPVVLSQLSATLMGIVDSAFVGRLGATELAAVGFANVWNWTVFCLLMGTASAVQIFVAQDHGSGHERRCGPWAWQASYLVVPAALLFAAALLALAPPALRALGPSEELQTAARVYLDRRIVGMPALVFAFVWMSFFRGIGDMRTPLVAIVAANAVNAVLDYGLVFGRLGLPAWGIAGAGTATALSEWLYAALLLAAARRARVARAFATGPVAPERRALRRFSRTGLPVGGQWLIDMLAFALFTTLVARMGDTAMAASQAFLMLLSLSFMQAVGIQAAASTLVGRYVGAGDLAAARRSFGAALRLGGILATGVGLLFLALPELAMRLFTDDPEVVALGAPLVRLGALFQLLDAVGIVASGALRGAGDTRWPFVFQALLAWGLFLPLAWLLGVVLGGGLFGAWVGGSLYVGVLAAGLLLRFRGGAWESIRI